MKTGQARAASRGGGRPPSPAESSPPRRGWLARAGRAGLARVRPLIVFYLAGMALFAVGRAVFLVYYRDEVGHFSIAEIFHCFRVGLVYDSAVLCYVLAPSALAVALAPRRWFNARPFRWVCGVAAAILLSGFLLACVSDLFFFSHYADRLNYLAFSYPMWRLEVLEMIWHQYPVGWTAALTLLLGYVCYAWFWRVAWPRPGSVRPDDAVLGRSAVGCVAVGLAVLGCLAPRHSSPDRETSPSYFSREHVLNRASLNCMYTLSSAFMAEISETAIVPAEYRFVDGDAAFARARALLAAPGDRFTDQPGNPLARVSDTGRPTRNCNVVVVIMESMGSQYFESLGGPTPWTPELESLGRRGLLFTRLYAVGTRTSRGIVGVLSGFPDMPTRPIAQNERLRGPFLTLAEVLRGRGYRTLFVHGGNLKFNDVKRYIGRHGFETIIDRNDFDAYVRRVRADPEAHRAPGLAPFETFWSVDDQSVFLRALEVFDGSDRPFFGVVLTLTNHPTFEVPHDAFDLTVGREYDLKPDISEEERAVRYADWAVGDFLRRARGRSWYDDTLFVLVADHCRSQRPNYPVDAANFNIYAAMLGPTDVVGPPRHVDTVASQSDLAPTILARLGGASEHCFIGHDVLGIAPEQGMALLQQNGVVGLVRGKCLFTVSPGVPGPLVRGFDLDLTGREQTDWPAERSAEAHRQAADGIAVFQSAVNLLLTRNYHLEQSARPADGP